MNIDEVPGFFGFKYTYSNLLHHLPRGGVFVEVGACLGASTCYAADLLQKINPSAKLYAVDIFGGPDSVWMHQDQESPVALAVQRHGSMLAGYGHYTWKTGVHEHIRTFVMPSVEVAAFFKVQSVDTLFIDGGHTYEAVKADLHAWWPVVKTKGTVAGDDYSNPRWPGVKQAVDEFFGGLSLKVYDAAGGCWVVA